MNTTSHFFSKFLKNKSGFTLMELMMVTGMLALFTLAVTELIRGQKALVIESEIAADIAQMKAEIQSLLSTPQHCNANLFFALPGEYPAIYACKTSNYSENPFCVGGNRLNPELVIEKFKIKSGNDWTSTGSASNRVRIVSIKVNVEEVTPPIDSSCGGQSGCGQIILALGGLKTIATMTVKFEKKYLTTTKFEEFIFTTSVVSSGVIDGVNLIGCSAQWNKMDILGLVHW